MYDALKEAVLAGDLDKAKELATVTEYDEFIAMLSGLGVEHTNGNTWADTYHEQETHTVREALSISWWLSFDKITIQFDKETGKLVSVG